MCVKQTKRVRKKIHEKLLFHNTTTKINNKNKEHQIKIFLFFDQQKGKEKSAHVEDNRH